MSGETPFELDATLLDDFFAEADDHLLAIRQSLLRLEAAPGAAANDPKLIATLFENFHSLKGISALVGLRAAETVAHSSEDLLRLVRDRKTNLTAEGVNLLGVATQKLEEIAAAFRSGKTLPEFQSVTEILRQHCAAALNPDAAIAEAAAPAAPGSPHAAREGLALWKYTYTPSKELIAKGINVNLIREELSKSGEILQAAPLVREGGALAFEFLVSSRGRPADVAAWAQKGVTVRAAEPGAAAPSAAADESETHNPFLAPSHFVRVDMKGLDDLMRITGEIVIHRSRLENQLAGLGGAGRTDARGARDAANAMGRALRQLREAVMRVRMVPVSEIFARLPFVVRDLERESRKKVRLVLEGQETAVDKYLIERLKDPLLHLVRNAFSHGVETPEERVAKNKPETATILLRAASVGDAIVLSISDDGKGIEPRSVLERAKSMGLEIPAVPDNAGILKILCSPGFSTRTDADRASGRGVGMAVVQATIRELGGAITLESQPDRGTKFTLRLPLTLAITDTIIVTSSGQTCAIPQNRVREILQTTADAVQTANGVEVVPYRGGVLPVVRLNRMFRLPDSGKGKLFLLVVISDEGGLGLLVDGVLGRREVVVHALRDPLVQTPGIAGATELGDGRPVLILDSAGLGAGNYLPRERLDCGAAASKAAEPLLR